MSTTTSECIVTCEDNIEQLIVMQKAREKRNEVEHKKFIEENDMEAEKQEKDVIRLSEQKKREEIQTTNVVTLLANKYNFDVADALQYISKMITSSNVSSDTLKTEAKANNVVVMTNKPIRDNNAVKLINMIPFKVDETSYNSYLYKGQVVMSTKNDETQQCNNIVVKYPLIGNLEQWENTSINCNDEARLYKLLQTRKCRNLLEFYGTHGLGLVIEEVDGGSLFDIVYDNHDVEKHVWNWSQLGKDIATALSYLNKCNISHNDLKPENICFSNSKNIWKLIDLGLATKLSCKVSRSIGTDGFRAPEIKVDGRLHVNSDVYGLGIIMKDSFSVWRERYDSLITLTNNNKAKTLYSKLKTDMKKLVVQMVETEPDKRPSVKLLVNKFKNLQNRENKLVELVK
jgi:serine/threonine protein kinase